jgi:hypothetical protein
MCVFITHLDFILHIQYVNIDFVSEKFQTNNILGKTINDLLCRKRQRGFKDCVG